VSAEFPGALTGFVLKLAVAFAGSPETLNATEPLPVTLMTTELFPPRVTANVEEDNETPKTDAELIVTDTGVEWTPPLPLIVRV